MLVNISKTSKSLDSLEKKAVTNTHDAKQQYRVEIFSVVSQMVLRRRANTVFVDWKIKNNLRECLGIFRQYLNIIRCHSSIYLFKTQKKEKLFFFCTHTFRCLWQRSSDQRRQKPTSKMYAGHIQSYIFQHYIFFHFKEEKIITYIYERLTNLTDSFQKKKMQMDSQH